MTPRLHSLAWLVAALLFGTAGSLLVHSGHWQAAIVAGVFVAASLFIAAVLS